MKRYSRLIMLSDIVLRAVFFLALALFVVALATQVSADTPNFTVYSSGSNFIIWNTSGVDNVSVDGSLWMDAPQYIGEYNLQSGSVHYIQDANNTSNVLFARLPASEVDTLLFWVFFIILYAFIVVSYKYPISAILPIIYGTWLVTTYIPSHTTEFSYYFIAMAGIVLSVASGIIGFRKE